MPRIFHLIKSLGRGGAEMLLAEGLRFRDRDRFVYGYGHFLPWKTAMVPVLREEDVEVVCFESRNSASILLSARRVAEHLRTWRADLVHCHLPLAGAVGRIAGRMAGVPVVYTEHNRMERYHPLTRRLGLITWNWQERVIAVSAEVASSIRAHADGRVPVDVVLNGVDVEKFDPDAVDPSNDVRRDLGIPVTAPVVGTVAVFRTQKALDRWLDAARLLTDRHPELHLLLVGDGPLRADLVEHAESLGLEDRVHFPGLATDVRPFLASMDVFMISSVFEGLPIALLEAMAMRVPVVATTVGGIPEVIEHGRNGFLVEPGRTERLVECASALLDDPDTRRRFGEEGRETVSSGFSMERMTEKLEATYLQVLNRQGR